MNVDIYGLKEITFTEGIITTERDVNLKQYLNVNLSQKITLLEKSLQTALNGTESNTLFFTLPEFFWNIPWNYICSEEEIAIHFDFYFDKLTENLDDLLERLVNVRKKANCFTGGFSGNTL